MTDTPARPPVDQPGSTSPDDPLDILYSDDWLIAINKPSRLLVHRSALDRHDTRNAVRLLSEQTGRYVYPVHRLDKPTSGVLLFALDKDSARGLARQFEDHQVLKRYTAVVRGYCTDAGVIDHPIRDRDARLKPRLEALTEYSNLATIELMHRVDRYPTSRYSLLDVQPQSGRRHQIRLHMKHIQHPLIGDTSYGKRAHNQLFADIYKCRRLLLHASSVQFNHPHSLKPLQISAPVTDAEFTSVLADSDWCWSDPQARFRLTGTT